MRHWVNEAVRKIEADFQRSADTHLIKLPLPCYPNVDVYLKDESTHPTGSLKHRLARSLFLYGLCNGHITQDTPIIEASSGSTAVSEAYFARLLGLPFIAVMPASTAKEKIKLVEFYGGRCHFVERGDQIYAEAERLAKEMNGHYMDQFTYAERATDWRGNNNIADSIFKQMEQERFPLPRYIVMSAGTGGTSATLGRYIRYRRFTTELVIVDPDNSVFYESYTTGRRDITAQCGSRIEGIGRPRVEPSFLPGVIDRMIQVPDGASIAALRWLEKVIGRKAGGSTGTNLWGALQLAKEMHEHEDPGSIVTVLCDTGERYLHTYHDDLWVREKLGDIGEWMGQLPST
ncbi:MAG: PLP-dependent cysteine synthase family protein [Pseudomonadales bacterium]|nr:PLP-dependent cysteine synthase family protein [Pseudomonadales bacterium]MCP5343511.1 PLP-dependent cysteine synthase family protein [Pseudomonadales bacterium]